MSLPLPLYGPPQGKPGPQNRRGRGCCHPCSTSSKPGPPFLSGTGQSHFLPTVLAPASSYSAPFGFPFLCSTLPSVPFPSLPAIEPLCCPCPFSPSHWSLPLSPLKPLGPTPISVCLTAASAGSASFQPLHYSGPSLSWVRLLFVPWASVQLWGSQGGPLF